MMFFPEGTRSRDGVMQAFKSGAFRLACDARVPVIPISLVGTETLLPKGSFRPNVTDVRIIVHPAISSFNKTPDALMDEAQRVVASGLPESQRNVRSRP